MTRWSDEKTLFFVECYKEHECLWNPTSYFYKSKAARADAYASLLEQFNDDNLTVQLLKTKIKNFRTTYHQELNKIRYSLQTGALLYKPTLCWFDALDSFLGDTVLKEYTRTIPHTSRKFDNFKRKLHSSNHTDFNPPAQAASANRTQYTLEVQPLIDGQEPSARKQVRLLTSNSITGQEEGTDSEKCGTHNLLGNTATAVCTPSVCADEFHYFGMNVAAQLRRLPLQTALQLQSEFQNTLYMARVPGHSSPGPDTEETIIRSFEDTESESVDQDADEKEFPIDIDVQDTIEIPLDSPLSHDLELNDSVFKRGWIDS